MGKSITLREDSLMAIKNSMVGTNSVSHNSICVNEARPEVDEFELGQESDNPPVGGNYCHVADEGSINESKIPQEFIDRAKELRPDKFSNWAVINLIDINQMPHYFQKKSKAYEFYKWMKMERENKPIIVNLDESINFNKNGLSINDDKILDKYNLRDLVLSKVGNYVTLNKIVANELGKGNGSRFMKELIKIADENGWILALTPDTSFGATSVGRLKNFYKRFGFKPNKGRNTDFNTRESMIRKPLNENKYDDLFNKTITDLENFRKQGAEKYGEQNWYAFSWMERMHPEVEIDPNDIKIYNALLKKYEDASKLWNAEDESETVSQQAEETSYDVISLAIEQYGTTSNLGQAGYILPDGRLLNFGSNGYREEDHRGIEGIYKKNNIPIWSDEYRYNYVVDFMNHGAIRCCVNGGILDMTKEPTKEQYFTIRAFVRKAVDVDIDFTDNKGNTLHSVSYSDARPQQVVADIMRYYEEGIKPQGNVQYESKKNNKSVIVNESQIKNIIENLDFEVDSSDIDLSSFKKRSELAPIWVDDNTLDSRVRLRLLDIADDFWEFVNLTWVKPSGIILTGSICNFNWSKFSDIDLHLVVDFDEIDDKTEFVRDYLDAKKNEWNNEHSDLTILGFPVELYVQNLGEMPQSGGIYDLEENEWVKKPSMNDVKPIGLDKFSIKDKAADIMTIIDDMYNVLNSTVDSHEIEEIGEDANYLWKKIKGMRKTSLEKNGESGAGNVVYKILRRTEYLDKLWKLRTIVYDRSNSINESKEVIKEYLEKDNNLPLYKYFKWASTASSCEKARDLAYSCSYYIGKYIRKIYYRYSEFEDLLNDDEFDYEDESLVEMFLNMLEENNLCDHFVSEMQDIVDYYELPSWCTMDFNRIVKNEWCIHFGSDSENIAREGFTGGTEDIDHLAYTNAGQQKHYAGYDFAFLINDRNVDYNEYGDEAVIFRTSGVEIFHYGDNQNQVIFWGPNVKSFIPIHQESGDWVVYGMNGQVLKRASEPSEIAYWATENLPQYRKQIMTGKNGYIPKMSIWDAEANKSKRIPYPIYRNESIQKYITLLKENMINEEWVGDGNSEHNPYKKRWDAERKALKDFVSNYGKLMQSKENGKLYKCYYDKVLSQLIGYNYCICIQFDNIEMKPKSVLYIRALDKFTPNIRQVNFDYRGRDNMAGTYDDARYNANYNVTESVNELNLYHASYSDFDKFNHKKYLSSGAGSQTFGWGTYLTDSYSIAKDYAEKFILLKFNEFIVKAEPEKYIENNGSYDEELIKEAAKTYKQIVRFDISMRPEGRWGKNSFDSLLKTDEKASENYDNALKEYEQAIQMAKSWAEDVLKKEFDTESFKANYPKNSILKISKQEYINNVNRQNTIYQLVKEIINNIWDDADKHVRKESYIYEVEIPDDNGLNYIDWNNKVQNEIIEKITNTLSRISERFGGGYKTMSKWREFLSYCNNTPKGEDIHDELGKLVGVETSIGHHDKAISLFLMQCGIDGIKYKAGTIYGLPEGADEGSLNYVIFDSNKVRITSKNLFYG